MKLTILIFMFVILGCLLVISNNNLAFSNSENVIKFGELFGDWITHILSNFKHMTGEVVVLNWSP
jgi:hypothetical protein